MSLDDREILELRQLCKTGGLSQDSLAALIDGGLSVPSLVKSEARMGVMVSIGRFRQRPKMDICASAISRTKGRSAMNASQ
jgi:hypothetical protein